MKSNVAFLSFFVVPFFLTACFGPTGGSGTAPSPDEAPFESNAEYEIADEMAAEATFVSEEAGYTPDYSATAYELIDDGPVEATLAADYSPVTDDELTIEDEPATDPETSNQEDEPVVIDDIEWEALVTDKEIREEISELPPNLSPYFVLGDLNEDGFVDDYDWGLLEVIVESDQNEIPEEVRCLAAGDYDVDGFIEQDDLAMLAADVLGEEPLFAPALYAQPYASCEYTNLTIAAPLEVRAGDTAIVQFFSHTMPSEPTEVWTLTEGVEVWWDMEMLSLNLFIPEFIEVGQSVTIVTTLASELAYTLSIPVVADVVYGNPDNPRDTPDPTMYGEELDDPTDCPQRGDGCAALVIDFSHHIYNEADSSRTASALGRVGCELHWVTPNFIRKPTVVTVVHGHARWQAVTTHRPPTQAELETVMAYNSLEWAEIWSAVDEHRALLSSGREVGIQILHGHGGGSDFGPCGAVGTEFDTGSYIDRVDFNYRNYRAARRNVCSMIDEDRSCYSGFTPMVIEELNNGDQPNCSGDFTYNHERHAAYEHDIALGLSEPDETIRFMWLGWRDFLLGGQIPDYGDEGRRTGNYDNLVNLFHLDATMDNPPSGYEVPVQFSDGGYNDCVDGNHVSAR